jgi:hypothetical protein
MYNMFRLAGDALHLLALVILFGKINQHQSCAGGAQFMRLHVCVYGVWLSHGQTLEVG